MHETLNAEKIKSNEFKSQTSLQSNSSGQTEFSIPIAPTNQINSDLTNSFNSLKLSFKSHSNSSAKQSSIKKTTKAEHRKMGEFPTDQSTTESPVNSQLPPLKNPKAKSVVKKTNKEKNAAKEINRENIDSLGSFESNLNSNGYKSDREEQQKINAKQQPNQQQYKIQRSTSSSVIEKRSSSNKSRPNSGNSTITPLYKKLRPVEDPILQILEQIRKILFISQVIKYSQKQVNLNLN